MAYRPYKSRRSILAPFKSLLEQDFAKYLVDQSINYLYEPIKLSYILPEQRKTYTPDFIYDPKSRRRISHPVTPEDLLGKVIIETKGRLTARDAAKMAIIKKTYPELDIRFIFPVDAVFNKKQKGRDGGKFRYSDWCIKHNYDYFIGTEPPKEWLK